MVNTFSFKELIGNKSAFIAVLLLITLMLAALIGPAFVSHDPLAMDLDNLKQPPGRHHLLGTDSTGRDILARLVYGARISLSVGVLASLFSLGIGIFFGLIAGYFGGRVD